MISRKTALWILAAVTVILAVIVCFLPRIPQPQSYHEFADRRVFLGIPNFDDVVSNAPFAVFGLWGLVYLFRLNPQERVLRFIDPRERIPYVILFIGVLLTAFGSSYYHWNPNNSTLVWDRIPMTIVFMSLISGLIMERISLRWGLRLLPVLLLIGVGSVLQWYWSEVRGVGDLRFYATVQAYAVIFVLLILLLPPRYTRSSDLIVIAGFYVLAKLLETFDRTIFSWGQIVSGHTLKHLAASMAAYWILRMLQKRQPLAPATSTVQYRYISE